MCGIIGIASNKSVSTNIINALKKLEYRGYDSAGLATIANGEINEKKCPGRVEKLEKILFQTPSRGNLGIGHVRIASPPIKFPDFYGIDMPSKKELLAANKNNDEICEYIGAKSLKFLSIQGMYKAIGFDKRNETYPQLTDHYFTGDYPVKPVDELGDSKITQLSLLSTASNN